MNLASTPAPTKSSNAAATAFVAAYWAQILATVQADKDLIVAEVPVYVRPELAAAWPILTHLVQASLPSVTKALFAIMENALGDKAPEVFALLNGIAAAETAIAAPAAPVAVASPTTPATPVAATAPVATPLAPSSPAVPVVVAPPVVVSPANAPAVPIANPVAAQPTVVPPAPAGPLAAPVAPTTSPVVPAPVVPVGPGPVATS